MFKDNNGEGTELPWLSKGISREETRLTRTQGDGNHAVSGGHLMMDAGHREWVSQAERPTPACVITM